MGARVGHLDADGIGLARTYQADHPALSTSETFALVLAEAAGAGSILLTSEPLLCSAAEARGLEVSGLLWMLDEMHRHGTTGIAQLQTAWRRGS